MNKYVVMMIAAIVMWGTTIPMTKWALETFHPFTLIFLRLFFAGLLFLPFTWIRARRKKGSFTIPWLRVCVLTFTGVAGYFTINHYGISLTSGVKAGILGALTPLLTTLLAVLYLKERIINTQWIGLFIGMIGVLIISIQPAGDTHSSTIGDLLILGSCLVWAIYMVQMKSPKGEEHLTSELFTALSLLIGSFMILPFAASEIWVYDWPELNAKAVSIVAFLTLFPTVGSYWLWNKSLEHISAARASAYFNALPLVNVVVSILLLGEMVTWITLVGGCITLFGVLLSERKQLLES